MEEKIKIPIQTETERFQKHIESPFNNRIFFSGIFGIGKTYFLKEFFNANKDAYDAYFVSPVNYSIASNKDIFKYIKFDIAFELLAKEPEFNKEYFNLSQTLPYFINNNAVEILKIILKYAGELGKGLKDLTELTEKAIKDNKDLNTDEQKEIIDYLKSVASIEGSLYEDDLIVELLSEKIQEAKQDKKAVLIIDDLDRLDPEHIFRILNVLAHQVDIDDLENNLFSFDKIIIVGDIENIKSIFHAKYGEKTNFSGYIDKFFDKEVYYFDNKQFINEKLDEILRNTKMSEHSRKIVNFQNTRLIVIKVLKELLIDLINNDLLNLRSLMKFQNQKLNFDNQMFKLDHEYYRDACVFQFDQNIIFEYLLKLYGNMGALEVAVNRIAELNVTKKRNDNFIDRCAYLIFLIDYKNHKLKKGEYIYNNKELGLEVQYEVNFVPGIRDKYYPNLKEIKINGKEPVENLPYGKLSKLAFEKYKEIKNNKA